VPAVCIPGRRRVGRYPGNHPFAKALVLARGFASGQRGTARVGDNADACKCMYVTSCESRLSLLRRVFGSEAKRLWWRRQQVTAANRLCQREVAELWHVSRVVFVVSSGRV